LKNFTKPQSIPQINPKPANNEPPAPRLPASEIEQAVRRAVARWLRTNENIRKLVASRAADEKQRVFERTEPIASDVEHLPVSQASEVFSRLALNTLVSQNEIEGTFEPMAALGLASKDEASPITAHFKIAFDRQNYGHETRLRLQPAEPDWVVKDDRLVELLEMDEAAVRSTETTRLRHLQRLARLSYLDPSIIRSILQGTQPKNLSARSLWRMGKLPMRFADQREVLGFS